jgi:hypothetical protein
VSKRRARLLGLFDHRRVPVLIDESQVEAVRLLVGLASADLLQRGGQAKDRLRVVGLSPSRPNT